MIRRTVLIKFQIGRNRRLKISCLSVHVVVFGLLMLIMSTAVRQNLDIV